MNTSRLRFRYLFCISSVAGCAGSTSTLNTQSNIVEATTTDAGPQNNTGILYTSIEWREGTALCTTTTHPRCGPMIQIAAGPDCPSSSRSCEGYFLEDITETQRRSHPNACCYSTSQPQPRRPIEPPVIGRPLRTNRNLQPIVRSSAKRASIVRSKQWLLGHPSR